MGFVRTHWVQFDRYNGEWNCPLNMAMKLLHTVRGGGGNLLIIWMLASPQSCRWFTKTDVQKGQQVRVLLVLYSARYGRITRVRAIVGSKMNL